VNPTLLSDLAFAVGRRRPGFPLALLRRLPQGVLDALHRVAFRRTVRQALRAPYYREAFARCGIDPGRVRGPEDLGAFTLAPEVLKGRPQALLCAEPELAIESSGTSGRVTRVYLSQRELDYNARQGALLLSLWGLGRGDRLLCTLDLGWGLGALLVTRGVRTLPLFAMVPGRVDPEEAYRRLARYGFNVVVSDPFWLQRLTEIARARGRPGPLRLLVGGGEGVTPRARAVLEGFWEAPLCMTYASTEAATVLGFECRARQGYHVNEFDFHVEVDAPDPEGWGEIVLTTLSRRVMPLVRYRTGDVARWLPGPCACGLRFRRLSPLRGRLDEVVASAWGNVHPDFFAALLADVDGLGDWQVALYERDLTPVFQFRLEVDGADGRRAAAVPAVLAALERHEPAAWRAWAQRLVEVEFTFFPPGGLRRRRKLLRLVDERASGAPPWVEEAVLRVQPSAGARD
jgi:phenylacetate-CoA ligase